MKPGTLLFGIPLLALSLAAQLPAEVRGRVTDPSGAAISNARVAAGSAVTRTDASGDYVLPVDAGTYVLSAEFPGFQPFRQDIEVHQNLTCDILLQLGAAAETVHVSAAAAPLLEEAFSGVVVESETMLALPMRDGNPLALATLAPGVLNLSEGLVRSYDNEGASQVVINGGAAGTHEFKLDGAPNTGGGSGNVAYVPPAGAVAELRIDSTPYDARNGFSSGSSVRLSLASGANRIHGSLAWYHENPVANANSFFSNKSGSGKDHVRENRPSVMVAGPLLRSRTFWMLTWEGIDASQPYRASNLVYTTPPPAERQGNLGDLLASGASYQIYDPKTTRPSTTAGRFVRDPFPGNGIPATRLDPTALKLIERYYPLPNLLASKPTGVNYTMPSMQANEFSNAAFRLDRAIGARHRVLLRGVFSDRAQDLEARFNGGAGLKGDRVNRGFGIDEIYAIGPQTVLNARYNYTRYVDNFVPLSAGLDLASLGFAQTYVNQILGIDARNLMLPDLYPVGYAELNPQAATHWSSDIHAAAIDVARIGRAHVWRMGGEHRVYRDASGNTGRSAGKLNFNTNWTRGPLDNSAAAPIGQGLASFLLGLPTDGSMDVNPSLAQQYSVSGAYVQDTWKARPRLTVNLGVRWEMEQPLTERYDRSVRGFDPETPLPIAAAVLSRYAKTPVPQLPAAAFAVRGGLTFAGVDGHPRALWSAGPHNFGPRVALAWSPGGKLVVRAGYGIFFDLARQNAIQSGFSRTTSLVASQDTGQTYVATLANPFPAGLAMPTGASLGIMTNVGQSLSVFPDRLLNPYQQRWEMAVQRNLGSGSLVEIAYVGNRGVHLRVARQLDPIPAMYLSRSLVRDNAVYAALTANVANPFYPLLPSTSLAGSTVQVAQLLRPHPQFTSIMTTGNDGFSWYHGLSARMQRRFARSFTATAAYTWSKFMDATAFLNESDASPARGISAQDRTHRVVASGIWRLPFGGLHLQGIYQRQSGAPLNFGNVLYYGGSLRADPTPGRWFNTALFERAPAAQPVDNIRYFPLRLGNARTMGLNIWDVGIMKSLRIADRFTLQFRADAFNALNHTHFAAPNTSPTSTDFGVVTATSQMPRRIEFSGRFQF